MSNDHKPVVLLVDDQMIIGEAVRRMLAAEPDIQYHYCQKGAEALATAARLKPTVILQDLVMPDADGLELVRGYRAQAETALTPLIVLSSKEEGAVKAEAFARGANDYVVKLPDPVELLARIRYHSRGYTSLLQRNEAFEALRISEAALAKELAKAAEYVRTLLPGPLTGPVKIDWRFVPSASLGGDCFDYFWIDDDHLAIYLLDVCGHGVGPALLGVSAMSTVRNAGIGGVDPRDPTAVLDRLNVTFQMEKHHGMYFTIWYGVFKRSSQVLKYSGGGHPPPLLFRSKAGAPERLDAPSLPIGVAADIPFHTMSIGVTEGASLVLYSDGATEVFVEPGKLWGVKGLTDFMQSQDRRDFACLDALHQRVTAISGQRILSDDFSAMLVNF